MNADLQQRVERVRELASNVGPSSFDSAEIDEHGMVECPMQCDCGMVEAETRVNIDRRAVTMQFFGIGDDFGNYTALWESVPEMVALINELAEKLEAAERDARRYRWMRDNMFQRMNLRMDGTKDFYVPARHSYLIGVHNLDDAIDSAMKVE